MSDVVTATKAFEAKLHQVENEGHSTVDRRELVLHSIIIGDNVTTPMGKCTVEADDDEFGLFHFEISLGPVNSLALLNFMQQLSPEPEEEEEDITPRRVRVAVGVWCDWAVAKADMQARQGVAVYLPEPVEGCMTLCPTRPGYVWLNQKGGLCYLMDSYEPCTSSAQEFGEADCKTTRWQRQADREVPHG